MALTDTPGRIARLVVDAPISVRREIPMASQTI